MLFGYIRHDFCCLEIKVVDTKYSMVCDRNQVLVSGTETKVQLRYWYWSRNFLFQNPKLLFQIFSHIFLLIGGCKFLKA